MHSTITIVSLLATFGSPVALSATIGGWGRWQGPPPQIDHRQEKVECISKHLQGPGIVKEVLSHFDTIAKDCLADVPPRDHDRVVYELLSDIKVPPSFLVAEEHMQDAYECLDRVLEVRHIQLGIGDPQSYDRLAKEQGCITQLPDEVGARLLAQKEKKWNKIHDCCAKAVEKGENPGPCVNTFPDDIAARLRVLSQYLSFDASDEIVPQSAVEVD